MELIVAVDRAGGIGRDGGMLYHLPADLKCFREITMGKTLLMGRNTFFSLPGKRPLPGRVNCVLSSQADALRGQYPAGEFGPFFYHNIEEFLHAHAGEAIMVIGGERVYRQCMPMCEKAHVTEVDAAAPADTFFRLDGQWRCIEREECMDSGIKIVFCTYIRAELQTNFANDTHNLYTRAKI